MDTWILFSFIELYFYYLFLAIIALAVGIGVVVLIIVIVILSILLICTCCYIIPKSELLPATFSKERILYKSEFIIMAYWNVVLICYSYRKVPLSSRSDT